MTKRVVIVGAGFGGLECAKALGRDKELEVIVIDRTNHHLFQPLLYQVATAGLAAPDIAAPVRSILSGHKNTRVLLGEVTDLDLEAKVLRTNGTPAELSYDWLVLGLGAKTSYFGHDEWEAFAPGLKTLDDAVEIRTRILLAFEKAETITDPEQRERLLTFVVIGGGPTGVELAGSIAELARKVLDDDFRTIRPEETRVVLIEAGPEILGSFGHELAASAKEQLEEIGVTVRTGSPVKTIDEGAVLLNDGTRFRAETVLWAAGVRATRLAAKVGSEHDRSGRVMVRPDCSVPGHPTVFCIGDMAHYPAVDAKGVSSPLPGVSPVAMQQGRYVAKLIQAEHALTEAQRRERKPFEYFDKGSMATIGRSRAIAKAGRIEMRGFVAWLAWLFVHLIFLVGFKNQVTVLINWVWQYVAFKRGARVIMGRRDTLDSAAEPRPAGATWTPAAGPRSERAPVPVSMGPVSMGDGALSKPAALR